MEAFEKLVEAKYFLTKMEKNIDDLVKFKFNLSAFLSASRSVTFYLQKEFAYNPKFTEWYQKKQNEMKEDPLFKFFNNKRVTVVHIKTIDVRGHHEVSFTESIGISDSVTFELRDADGNIKETGSSNSKSKLSPKKKTERTNVTRRWFFTDFNDEDAEIMPLCLRYIRTLQSIVDEASKNI